MFSGSANKGGSGDSSRQVLDNAVRAAGSAATASSQQQQQQQQREESFKECEDFSDDEYDDSSSDSEDRVASTDSSSPPAAGAAGAAGGGWLQSAATLFRPQRHTYRVSETSSPPPSTPQQQQLSNGVSMPKKSSATTPRQPINMVINKYLIQKLNKIQDLFSTLGYDPIELPKIVVVGTQSAGKSSVLESLVKRSFLPRGTGIVTRCPLVLQLNRCPLDDRRRLGIREEEWGEFHHAPGRVFRMDEICAEIEARTEAMAGRNKGIVSEPITLKVYSPHVVDDLTLVDLPGLTKVAMGDQPDDIEDQIKKVIDYYIANPMTIILAVVTANVDMATNESLKLAKSVDPEGKRTLGVVTKVDLMDRGTNARDILNGKVIPVKLGIVGVVNRSQQDVINNKSIEDTQLDEQRFFEKYYPDVASRQGSTFLAQRLSDLLSDHMNDCLPEVKHKMEKEVEKCKMVLATCGESIRDKKTLLTSFINEFIKDFRRLCETGPCDLKSTTLCGGAKICDILNSSLEKTYASFHPCKAYDLDEVVMAIRQSNALKPHFFVSEPAFEALVKPQIKRMQEPALVCVEEVKKELLNTCFKCIPDRLELRFPELKRDLVKVVQSVVENNAAKPIDLIKDLITAESSHITYYRIDVLKDEFRKLLSEDKSANNGSTLPCLFNSNNKIREQLRKKLCTNIEDKAEIKSDMQLLDMSHQDVKHAYILGKMLTHYYQLVAESMQDAVAKYIVTFLVSVVRDTLHSELLQSPLLSADRLDELFQESRRVTHTRDEHERRLQTLRKALDVLGRGR